MKGDTINTTRHRMSLPKHMTCLRCLLAVAAIAVTTAVPAAAQISFTTAIDLALKNNPRVLAAQDEVDKARAALTEAKDAYIPTLVGGSGLGYSYGFPHSVSHPSSTSRRSPCSLTSLSLTTSVQRGRR